MKGMRHIRKPGWASLLVLGLVLLRGLVPAGFMLAPVDGHLAFVLCDADASMPAMPAGAMPASHQHLHMAMDHAAHGHGAHRAADLRRCQGCRCWRAAPDSSARRCQRLSRRLSSVSDRYANPRPAVPRTSSDLENQLRLMQAAFPQFASAHPS
jgi:hypothetical protein